MSDLLRLDASDRDEFGVRCQLQRLMTRIVNDAVALERESLSEKGNSDALGIDELKIFRSLPSPEDRIGKGIERVSRNGICWISVGARDLPEP